MFDLQARDGGETGIFDWVALWVVFEARSRLRELGPPLREQPLHQLRVGVSPLPHIVV
jgi:hypothetical protein